jgi:NADPH2 dehydrogenase
LLETLRNAHVRAIGNDDDLVVGLQLTHSGRYSRPESAPRPRIAYRHPLLDRRLGIADDSATLSDDELYRIIDRFIAASRIAARVGFDFVDVKHCHAYLGHELLSAHTRPGPFGGSLENRTRFARLIIQGIAAVCPGLMVGVRFSAFDFPPFRADASGVGVPEEFPVPYRFGFGCNPANPLQIDLSEPIQFIQMLAGLGVRLINVSGGSPYYNPHILRPAIFPPTDGYLPPEDPLVGVARHIDLVRQLKSACPESLFVGSGYTYLQDYLPHVAQAVVRAGWVDFVGMGRMALTHWELPAQTLAGQGMDAKRLCRTFSDCTSGPRNGMISGCFPLDAFYRDRPEYQRLKRIKTEGRKS